MRFSIKKISFLYIKRNKKEQLLVMFLCVSAMYLTWDNLVNTTYATAMEKIQTNKISYQRDIGDLRLQASRISLASAEKEFKDLKKTVDQKEKELSMLKDKVNEAKKNITSPREIVKLIKEILKKTQGVRLVSIEGLQAIVLNLNEGQPTNSPTTPSENPNEEQQLYKPGLKLVLEGDYFQTMSLLKGLEESNWQIYWEAFDFKIKKYPLADVAITIRTLSIEKDWIGV